MLTARLARVMDTATSTVVVALAPSVTVQRMTAVRFSPAVGDAAENVVPAAVLVVIVIAPPDTFVHA